MVTISRALRALKVNYAFLSSLALWYGVAQNREKGEGGGRHRPAPQRHNDTTPVCATRDTARTRVGGGGGGGGLGSGVVREGLGLGFGVWGRHQRSQRSWWKVVVSQAWYNTHLYGVANFLCLILTDHVARAKFGFGAMTKCTGKWALSR